MSEGIYQENFNIHIWCMNVYSIQHIIHSVLKYKFESYLQLLIITRVCDLQKSHEGKRYMPLFPPRKLVKIYFYNNAFPLEMVYELRTIFSCSRGKDNCKYSQYISRRCANKNLFRTPFSMTFLHYFFFYNKFEDVYFMIFFGAVVFFTCFVLDSTKHFIFSTDFDGENTKSFDIIISR